MKKWFVVALASLLVLLMVFGTAQADTDGIDLSRLTDDQLLSLIKRANEELVKRGIEKTATLSQGTYITGIDIPAGKYIYTCLAKGSDWGNVTVRAKRGEGRQLLWEIVSAPSEGEAPQTIFMSLNEGDELKSGVPFSLTIQTSIKFH